jgi:hypothetical protein
MTRDHLRLVLQRDDQLVKIKTVTAIDDHSDREHPGVRQDLQSRQVIHCDRKPRIECDCLNSSRRLATPTTGTQGLPRPNDGALLVLPVTLLVRRIGRIC